MNLVFGILSSIVVAARAAVGVAVGLAVGAASTKLEDLDGPPGGVALISSAGLFGLLFGITAFVVSLQRYIKRRTTQTSLAGFPN
jgi:Na+/proline symporter